MYLEGIYLKLNRERLRECIGAGGIGIQMTMDTGRSSAGGGDEGRYDE
jgi:hypothetical protein